MHACCACAHACIEGRPPWPHAAPLGLHRGGGGQRHTTTTPNSRVARAPQVAPHPQPSPPSPALQCNHQAPVTIHHAAPCLLDPQVPPGDGCGQGRIQDRGAQGASQGVVVWWGPCVNPPPAPTHSGLQPRQCAPCRPATGGRPVVGSVAPAAARQPPMHSSPQGGRGVTGSPSPSSPPMHTYARMHAHPPTPIHAHTGHAAAAAAAVLQKPYVSCAGADQGRAHAAGDPGGRRGGRGGGAPQVGRGERPAEGLEGGGGRVRVRGKQGGRGEVVIWKALARGSLCGLAGDRQGGGV